MPIDFARLKGWLVIVPFYAQAHDLCSLPGMIGGVPVGMQMPGQGGMLALPSAQVAWPCEGSCRREVSMPV